MPRSVAWQSVFGQSGGNALDFALTITKSYGSCEPASGIPYRNSLYNTPFSDNFHSLAHVAELADAYGSGPYGETRGGSSPLVSKLRAWNPPLASRSRQLFSISLRRLPSAMT